MDGASADAGAVSEARRTPETASTEMIEAGVACLWAQGDPRRLIDRDQARKVVAAVWRSMMDVDRAGDRGVPAGAAANDVPAQV